MVSLGSVLGCLWGAIALQLSSTTLQFGGPVGLIVLSIVSFFTPTIMGSKFWADKILFLLKQCYYKNLWITNTKQAYNVMYQIVLWICNKTLKNWILILFRNLYTCATESLSMYTYSQGSRKMKFLGGGVGGAAQDGTVMYSYMSHNNVFATITNNSQHCVFCILNCQNKQKDLTGYKHWNYWESFGVTMHVMATLGQG